MRTTFVLTSLLARGDELVIQKAVEKLRGLGIGGEIVLREGTYLVNNPIKIGNGITLRGISPTGMVIKPSDYFSYDGLGVWEGFGIVATSSDFSDHNQKAVEQ